MRGKKKKKPPAPLKQYDLKPNAIRRLDDGEVHPSD